VAATSSVDVIVPGSGNVIVPGPGNVIVPGPGNVIVPGSGNVIVPGSGNVIVPGSGKVIGASSGNEFARIGEGGGSLDLAIMTLPPCAAERAERAVLMDFGMAAFAGLGISESENGSPMLPVSRGGGLRVHWQRGFETFALHTSWKSVMTLRQTTFAGANEAQVCLRG
jgi:hypothetical protein